MSRTRRAAALMGATGLAVLAGAGPAGAAPTSTVRVDVGGVARCSAVVVGPRFALTARSCVVRGGRRVAARRLSVVGARNARDVMGVAAAIPYASRTADLALLQLTSATSLPAVRPTAPRATVVRRGRTARISGWARGPRPRTARGRFVPRAQCGPATSVVLCVRLARGVATPARRCAEAGGAPLLLRAGGRDVVAGIGAPGRRGCSTPARLRFTRLDRASLRWIAATIRGSGTPAAVTDGGGPSGSPTVATGAPAGGGGTTPGGGTTTGGGTPPGGGSAPGARLADYVGTWSGTLDQRPIGRSYAATITIDRDGDVGQVVGRSSYATARPCGGDLSFSGRGDDGGMRFLERLTFGTEQCISDGTVSLAFVSGRDALTYTWTGDPRNGRSDGVLERRP